jgi:hypothetical protein
MVSPVQHTMLNWNRVVCTASSCSSSPYLFTCQILTWASHLEHNLGGMVDESSGFLPTYLLQSRIGLRVQGSLGSSPQQRWNKVASIAVLA